MSTIKAFARDFWRAIGDPNNTLVAIRHFLIAMGVVAYVLACLAFGEWIDSL